MVTQISCLLAVVLFGLVSVEAVKLSIVNRCGYTVWPGAIPGGGVRLDPGQSWNLDIPAGTQATRFWARTGCNFDGSGRGSCVTGDCGNMKNCQVSGAPPTTLAEITFGRNGVGDSLDYLDISLVDGFNVPMSIQPTNNQNRCQPGGRGPTCAANINAQCPQELRVPQGCDSACTKFGGDLYCCRGQYTDNCPPTKYSRFFKQQCPDAYSYAKDDQTSTFTCPAGTNYDVVMCP
ncbi:protein P21 [Nilaparvata lugens]|uniref:protein P21 n=1 Tax=Nilaparvata lugens TaxID=108931 RepID=UPI00193C9C04|nr:protein P21 [Nilaparvata lugens]